MAERRVRSYTRNGKVVKGHSRKRKKRPYGTLAATRDTLIPIGAGAVTGEVARRYLLSRDPIVKTVKEDVAKKTAQVYPLVKYGLIREGKTISEAEVDARKAANTAAKLGRDKVKKVRQVMWASPFNHKMRAKAILAAGAVALPTAIALHGSRRWRKRKDKKNG